MNRLLTRLAFAIVACSLAAASVWSCARAAAPPTQYEIRGQVIGVRADVGEVRLKHEAIAGYMEAMTMGFAVKDRASLQPLKRGDLVRGTLMVTETDAWIEALEKTGSAEVIDELDETSAPAPAFDLLEPGQRVPDTPFVDHEGRPWSITRARGKAVALTFIYTRCPLPTYCPLMDRNFRAAQQAVATRAGLKDRVQFVTLSFDPDYDTPAVLKQHAASLGADLSNWTFLTGGREEIEAFAARFGVSVMREPATPGVITHNLRTAVIDPSGTVVSVFGGSDWKPATLVDDLQAAASR